MVDETKADELTAKYIKLRDFKDKINNEGKDKLAKINEEMQKIELAMMTFLNETGLESSKTVAGTFHKHTVVSARVADRDSFVEFVMSTDATQFIENRAPKAAVDEYLEEHGKLPPGVDITKMVSVRVKRPATR